VVEPRHIAVSLRQALSRTRLVLGHARAADRQHRTIEVVAGERYSSTGRLTVPWDRLLLAPVR
jgi:NADH:ubiquinone reductase (H+-translocating)